LGVASHLDGMKKVAVIGGGLGVAIAYPQAKALHDMGAEVDVIVGFRNTDLMILMDELKAASTNLYVMTDDGSNGHKGFVTSALEEQLKAGKTYGHVIAIGPLVMMRAVVNITKQYNIPTVISMNPIMIDGTGMCGCCRVTVGGEMKFACVDGPDFDGFQVDWDEAIARGRMYRKEEAESLECKACNLKNVELQSKRGGN
jgi:ferredoxin--NADP+ reductase